MNINEAWLLREVEKKSATRQFPGATVCMDDGAYQTQSANRARRMVALWNAFLGVPLSEIQKLANKRMKEKGWKKRSAKRAR